jgi:hypothetical protein
MKTTLKSAAVVLISAAFLSLPAITAVQAQNTNEGVNSGLPGGASGSDTNKPGNGDHGNNGSNGG